MRHLATLLIYFKRGKFRGVVSAVNSASRVLKGLLTWRQICPNVRMSCYRFLLSDFSYSALNLFSSQEGRGVHFIELAPLWSQRLEIYQAQWLTCCSVSNPQYLTIHVVSYPDPRLRKHYRIMIMRGSGYETIIHVSMGKLIHDGVYTKCIHHSRAQYPHMVLLILCMGNVTNFKYTPSSVTGLHS